MVGQSNFNWEKISWEDFQTLTIHFAQNLYPDTKFEEFLKKGHTQLGIDVKSYVRSDGTLIAIQCKREKKLALSDLKKIINEFERQPLVTRTSEFVIATTADLQKPQLQSYLMDTAIHLQKEFKIAFLCWDINFLDEQLKAFYSIVYFYFGKQAAEENCFPYLKLTSRFTNPPVANFIPRRVFDFNINDGSTHSGTFLFNHKTYSFQEIFKENRLLSKKVCLIADAYQGKTQLIRQTAYELEHCEIPFQPLVIQIKAYPIQPIDNLLNQLYGEWKMIPAKDLVLFLDGMDEVRTDQFDEAVRHINVFSIAYPFISIVFSCRKLFYHRHRVKSILEDFNTYELYPIQFYDVVTYLKKRLGNRYEQFDHEISRAGISNFLYHPFYLTNLVDSFLKPPYKLPESKLKVLENFVEESFNKQSERRTTVGQLHQNVVRYKKAIQKLAFALQLSGVNSFKDIEIQHLFKESEIELLQHNSLVTVNGDIWSFNNALFQEHLAAMVLSKMCIEDILSFVTVGKRNKKIKTKWIQTISSLFNILEESDDRSKVLIRFIEKDNIELIFTAEKTKFSSDFRLSVLKALINKCLKYQIRPMLIYEEDVASFINYDTQGTQWLIRQLSNKKYSVLNRTTLLRIIRGLASLEGFEKLLIDKCSLEVNKTTVPYLAGLIFSTLSNHKLGNQDFISEAIKNPMAEHHEYRNGLYELILALNFVDQFYSFGLAGYKALIVHNQKISHAGSENNFERFLLAANTFENWKLLLRTMQENDWIEYYDRHSIQAKDFVHAVLKKAAQLYQTDNLIVFPVVAYIRTLGRKYLRDEYYIEIDAFFKETNSYNLAVRIIIEEILNEKDWELNALITEDVFDYLLFEFDQLPLNFRHMKSCVSGLRYKNKNEVADKLASLIINFTERKVIEEDENVHIDYLKLEEQKRTNDLKYISSQGNFRTAIVDFFNAHGKEAIPENELYIDFARRGDLRKVCDSNFLYFFLLRWVRQQDKTVYLIDALRVIDNNDAFDFYRAKEIFNYNFLDPEKTVELIKILENYYFEQIETLDFENCIKEEGNSITYKTKQKLTGEIFERFGFKTDSSLLIKLVWVDTSGIRGFDHNTTNNRKSISQKILEQLDDKGLLVFRDAVLENIRKGILSSSVLGTHLDICRHLKITEAVNEIIKIIQKHGQNHLNDYEVIDVYLDLGGDCSKLVPYFKQIDDYNSYTFVYLIKKLSNKYRREVIALINKAVDAKNTSDERKLDLAAEMVNLGEEKGFVMLMNFLEANNRFPNLHHSKLDIKALKTEFVLAQLKYLMYFTIDPDFENLHFHESPRNTIIDWLYTLAGKSEEDMELVTEFLYEVQTKLRKTNPNASQLFWYSTNITERFRDSDKTVKNINQVQKILSAIEL